MLMVINDVERQGDNLEGTWMARGTEANRSNRKATMTDVARAAGCSQATVSFVLNNAVGVKISEETRQKVILAARAL